MKPIKKPELTDHNPTQQGLKPSDELNKLGGNLWKTLPKTVSILVMLDYGL